MVGIDQNEAVSIACDDVSYDRAVRYYPQCHTDAIYNASRLSTAGHYYCLIGTLA